MTACKKREKIHYRVSAAVWSRAQRLPQAESPASTSTHRLRSKAYWSSRSGEEGGSEEGEREEGVTISESPILKRAKMKTSSKKKRCGKERDSPTCFSNANLPSLGNHIIKYKYRHRDGRWLVVLGIWYLKVPALRQQHQVVGTTDVIKTRWVVWGMKSRDLRRTRRMTVEMVMVVMKIIYRQEVIIVHHRRCGCAKANVLL